MPINILFIESEDLNQDSIKALLKDKVGIKYHIIDDFHLLPDELNLYDYTHIVASFIIDDRIIIEYLKHIKIPLLVVTTYEINNFSLNKIQPPLSFSKLFSFICEKNVISYETLEKYVDGNMVFLNKLKEAIEDEFKLNLKELPLFIKTNNLVQIQNNVHKLISKFALINMIDSYNLSIEIDKKIIEEPEIQLDNLNQILVDIEIALIQLK